jgi:protein-tyrosine phosphatase
MDDGAGSVDEALEMLGMAAGQGVRCVCATPHYYHYRESPEEFCLRREKAYGLVREAALGMGVEIRLGSETFLTPGLANERDIGCLCVEGTRKLLLEAPHGSAFQKKTTRLIERVMSNLGVVPVLAHIERYPALLRKDGPLDQLLEMGCLAQANLSSLNGGFALRRRLLRLIVEGKVHYLGTDAHNTKDRPPDYTPLEKLEKRIGVRIQDSGFRE